MGLAILILAVASLIGALMAVMGKLDCKVPLLLLAITVLVIAVAHYSGGVLR